MPKISYTPKADEGFDNAGVTALQIEQKIAEIQTILRGMVDEDNLLAYDEDATAMNIVSAVVGDIPSDTNPVNHCMKFFGFLEQEESVVTKLYDTLTDITEVNPALSTVGGIQDTEMLWSYDQGRVEDETFVRDKFNNVSGSMIKDYEIPANYVPIKWKELWEHVKDFEIKRTGISSGYAIIGKIASLDDFLDDFQVKADEFVTFFQINRTGSEQTYDEPSGGRFTSYLFDDIQFPHLNYLEGDNKCSWSARLQIRYINEEGFVLVRFIPSVLCKVLP